MKAILWALFFTAPFLFAGCRTGVILKDTPLGISETRRTVVTVFGEPRSVSPNGRELYSKYYDKKGVPIERVELVKERFYTLVTILGDRRPYDIQVEVIQEERDDDGIFQVSDRDEAKAAPLAEKLKKALHQSLDSRNIIDDFRSF